jgi:hypothetical protein
MWNSGSLADAAVLLGACCRTVKTGGLLVCKQFVLYTGQFFCVVIAISCMYCLAYLPPSIFVCTRQRKCIDTLLNWSSQNCTVPVIVTMKNERVLPSFVVACVYDSRVCNCTRCITKLKKGATLACLYLACVDHNAGLPNFLQEAFSHAMLQRKLDKHVHLSKAFNLFV